MQDGYTSPKRLKVFGNCLLNKLKADARNRVKREASKKRRALLKKIEE